MAIFNSDGFGDSVVGAELQCLNLGLWGVRAKGLKLRVTPPQKGQGSPLEVLLRPNLALCTPAQLDHPKARAQVKPFSARSDLPKRCAMLWGRRLVKATFHARKAFGSCHSNPSLRMLGMRTERHAALVFPFQGCKSTDGFRRNDRHFRRLRKGKWQGMPDGAPRRFRSRLAKVSKTKDDLQLAKRRMRQAKVSHDFLGWLVQVALAGGGVVVGGGGVVVVVGGGVV